MCTYQLYHRDGYRPPLQRPCVLDFEADGMNQTVIRTPPDIFRFVSIEHEQFLVCLARNTK